MEKKSAKGYLLLEDGTRYEGKSFGFPKNKIGEVVVNTAMVGYPESLTDPSYMGQILVQTFPMIGNYGMPPCDSVPNTGLSHYLESDKMWVQGYIVSDYSEHYSHWNAESSLAQCLINEKVPALYGVDTRALTKHIREKGVMKGSIVIEGVAESAEDEHFEDRNLVAEASCKEVITYGEGAKRILFIDCGTKHNILRRLIHPDVTLIRVPAEYDFTSMEYDALFVSNGPGNPEKCTKTIANIQKAFKDDKPCFGVCMGHQLFALAVGASIKKLQYGHHGHNQPVQEMDSKKCYITSQNHCYCVAGESLPSDWKEWFVNFNDGTNAGIRHINKPFFSTQFHPECCGGPTDTLFLFDQFLRAVINK